MKKFHNTLKSTSKVNQSLPVIRRFGKYFHPYLKEIPLIFGLIFISSITQAIPPFILGWSIDNLILKNKLSGLAWMLLLLAIVYLIGFICSRILITRVGVIMQRILAQLRQDIMNKLQALPLAFFDNSKAGDLMSRLLSDINTLNQLLKSHITASYWQLFWLIGQAQ